MVRAGIREPTDCRWASWPRFRPTKAAQRPAARTRLRGSQARGAGGAARGTAVALALLPDARQFPLLPDSTGHGRASTPLYGRPPDARCLSRAREHTNEDFGADPVDAIMAVMDAAFDPAFGEAWNRRQAR